jgi:hypothetical protein
MRPGAAAEEVFFTAKRSFARLTEGCAADFLIVRNDFDTGMPPMVPLQYR